MFSLVVADGAEHLVDDQSALATVLVSLSQELAPASLNLDCASYSKKNATSEC